MLIYKLQVYATTAKIERISKMKKYKCIVCGYIYDPAENDNVAFENLPDDYACPLCGVGKDQFEIEE